MHQLLQMGEAAASLLNNPIYNVAHRMAVNDAIEAWSRTLPKEREKRESLWQEVQALGRVAETMGTLVHRAQEELQKQNEEQNNHEQQYYDNQGFGVETTTPEPKRFQ